MKTKKTHRLTIENAKNGPINTRLINYTHSSKFLLNDHHTRSCRQRYIQLIHDLVDYHRYKSSTMAKNFRYNRLCRVHSTIATYVHMTIYVSINDRLDKPNSITHNYKNTIEIKHTICLEKILTCHRKIFHLILWSG